MRCCSIRGGSVVELALLTPFLSLLLFCFLHLGLLFLRQIQLERLAAELARELATFSPQVPSDVDASRWLIRHHWEGVESSVSIRQFPTIPRALPRNNSPLRILFLTLRRPFRGTQELQAQAREVIL